MYIYTIYGAEMVFDRCYLTIECSRVWVNS